MRQAILAKLAMTPPAMDATNLGSTVQKRNSMHNVFMHNVAPIVRASPSGHADARLLSGLFSPRYRRRERTAFSSRINCRGAARPLAFLSSPVKQIRTRFFNDATAWWRELYDEEDT